MRIRTLLAAFVAPLLALLVAAGGVRQRQRHRRRRTRSDGGETSRPPPATTVCAGETTDLLAQVCDKGKLTVSTDPAYPPQSSLNEQTGEYEGFDIDVATEIAKRLGVDVAWEAPAWDVITAGSWNGRWDTTSAR